jgi:2-iminobutanoate/2-iminopropanoate deaminase
MATEIPAHPRTTRRLPEPTLIMRTITSIQAPGTKRPVGHYSQAIVHDGLVFVSGQLPADLETGVVEGGSIESQTERTLANVARVLEAAGSGLDRLIQVTIYVSDIAHWPIVNATYARVLGAHRPSRAIVPVTPLHSGAEIEIQAIAMVRPRRRAAPRKKAPRKAGLRRAARRPAAPGRS